MGLIYDQKKIISEIIQKGVRGLTRSKTCQVPGIILNAGAEAGFFHHFYIKIGSFGNTLGFQKLVFAFKVSNTFFQFFFDCLGCTLDLFHWYYIMRSRKNPCMGNLTFDLTGKHIDLCDPVDFIAEKLYTDRTVRVVGREDLQSISTYPEGTAVKIHFIPGVLDIDQFPDHFIPVFGHARPKRDHHVLEFLRRTQTVNAGNRRYNDHITPFGHGSSSGKTKLVDLIIDG